MALDFSEKKNKIEDKTADQQLLNCDYFNDMEAIECKVIRIVNIDPSITEEILKEFLRQTLGYKVGDLFCHEIHIRTDTKLNKSFGYVIFHSYNDAKTAVEKLDGCNYNGTHIFEVAMIAPNLDYKKYSDDSASGLRDRLMLRKPLGLSGQKRPMVSSRVGVLGHLKHQPKRSH